MLHDDVRNDDAHQDNGQQKLIRMANQIATFFLSQPDHLRAEGVANHINKFWEPRMRRHLFEHLDNGGAGLLPLVVEASKLIRRPESQAGSELGVREDAAGGVPCGKGTAEGKTLFEPKS